jgi:hypothetical protein
VRCTWYWPRTTFFVVTWPRTSTLSLTFVSHDWHIRQTCLLCNTRHLHIQTLATCCCPAVVCIWHTDQRDCWCWARSLELLSCHKSWTESTQSPGMSSPVCHFLSSDLFLYNLVDSLKTHDGAFRNSSYQHASTGTEQLLAYRLFKMVAEPPSTTQYNTMGEGPRVYVHDLTALNECNHYVVQSAWLLLMYKPQLQSDVL